MNSVRRIELKKLDFQILKEKNKLVSKINILLITVGGLILFIVAIIFRR